MLSGRGGTPTPPGAFKPEGQREARAAELAVDGNRCIVSELRVLVINSKLKAESARF